ncbi:zinc finger CCCH domain-containing protein 7B-like [Gigantopelta aegis]|uniref:zinc finger CCCH domain-containing protein 7B-like n=1 Tax=Gigantopelta aegis TaxID=1735272 RepID=UPI001B88D9D4|nr:zinc finger CCCH domain-containing protein 7B-like [Gigantopelta aegis]
MPKKKKGKLVETASAQQVMEVDWPLKDEFHFRLACQKCFVKTGEGIKGYNYKEGLHHNCDYDIMLIKLKQRPDVNWIKVRPRAKRYFGQFFTKYKICINFQREKVCQYGEKKCTFPHHIAEKKLWELDWSREFNIKNFITEMQNKRIFTSFFPGSIAHPDINPVNQKQDSPELSSNNKQPHTCKITQQPPQKEFSPVGQGSQQAADFDGMKKLENPLKAHYDFRILCKECLVPSNQPGLSIHKPHVHNCEQNVLALYKRGEPSYLMRVRERTNHRDFPGSYIICNSIKYGRPDMCRFGKEKCSFAHNRVEQILWTQEKEGSFNVSEFILQNRSATGGAKGYTVEELLKKHGGNLKFICRQCFCARPPRIEELERKGYCSANREHSWKNSKVLAHIGSQGGITIINKRVFVHKSAYFKFCYWKSFCKHSLTGSCVFAHSMVERDVWMCERDGDLSQEQVVDKCNAIMSEFSETEPPARDLCPYNVQVLCGTCWEIKTISKQDGSQDKCIKGHNDWHYVKIFMLMPDKKEIRPLPRRIPARLNIVICRDFLANRRCRYHLGSYCQFAHSEEEKDVWVWMCENNSKFSSYIQSS